MRPEPTTEDLIQRPNEQSSRKLLPMVAFVFFVIVIITSITIWIVTTPPQQFVENTIFEVTPGMSARAIAEQAAEQHLVRSPLLLYAVLVNQFDPTSIYAGTYRFSSPQNVFGVARTLASRNTETPLLRVTFPEGIRAQEMAIIAASALPNVTATEYETLATEREGYLFPETYFVPEEFTTEQLITLQEKMLVDVLASYEPLLASSTLTEYEVLTLASIVEREANDETSMKMVAGILQNRLDIGMALQADATIEYILDTPLNELLPGQLATELRETDSLYNSYKQPGLPPTPIGNPGRQSIEAVLAPTPSEFLFYITGTDGTFYYAETLTEHNENIARYLR